MASFLNYRNTSFSLQNETYYANKISISAQATTPAVVLNDGTLLNYAPDGAVVGSLSADFYLTGAIPEYLNITGTSETRVSGRFASVLISGLYPKSISFSVEPFQPILVSANFDWYGNVSVQSFLENNQGQKDAIAVPEYIANGYRSYINKQNLSGVEYITNFSYESSCDRPAFYNVEEKIPFRVAKLNKNVSVNLTSNDLGNLIDITGKTAVCQIVLQDMYGTTLNTFNVSGVLNNQSYESSEGGFLLASAKIEQLVTEKKTLI
jgi:hypothetical protein